MTAKKLRVLHIIDSLDPRQGGTVECVRQVGAAVAARGHAVEVASCRDVPGDAWLASFPLKVHALGPALGKYAYTPRLRAWLREQGRAFDAWIINGLWQFHGLGASRIAHRLGVPYFVYAHGMLDPWSRRAAPLKYVKKLAYWAAAERWMLDHAAAILFTSQEESVLARGYFPVAGWREQVVGNGIADPPRVARADADGFRAAHGIDAGKQVVLSLGRIHPKKGIDLLLRAFASLPAARERLVLVVTGEGEAGYVESLRQLGGTLGIEANVRWTGGLYGAEKWNAFAASDLFVLPSHQENFGIALVESLAAGVPVCTTTGVNIHPMVTRYGAGFVCRDDAGEVAACLARWIAMGEGEKDAMRAAARRCFEEQFRVEAAAARLLEALHAAIGTAAVEAS